MNPSPALVVTVATLDRIRSPALREAAAAALERGEAVRLVLGSGPEPVETVVLEATGRAGQAGSGPPVWGDWSGGSLHVGSHMLDVDGGCVCPACDLAAGFFGDDDE